MPRKNLIRAAAIVALILLIPLFGNLFVEGWNWSLGDFVVMGALLFITGLAIDCAIRKLDNLMYRVIAVTIIVLAFLTLWAELAVGAASQLVYFLFH